MFGGDQPDVIQPEAEALDIVNVARRHAVELIEDMRLRSTRDAHAVVGDAQDDPAAVPPGRNADMYLLAGLFQGIVDQVVQGMREVEAVGEGSQPFG